jgi:hypothetical protein
MIGIDHPIDRASGIVVGMIRLESRHEEEGGSFSSMDCDRGDHVQRANVIVSLSLEVSIAIRQNAGNIYGVYLSSRLSKSLSRSLSLSIILPRS